jgi:two-component system, sensor histidine kinase and response regulator
MDQILKKAKILIIDDQIANIEVLEGLLMIQDYTNLKSITDSREAVSEILNFKPDIVLLDLMMPHLSGFDIMKLIQIEEKIDWYLPILVLTADISINTKQKALASGAKDFLTKPFDLIEVALRIKNLLTNSYLMFQLKNQNENLEIKVAERTNELMKTNQELLLAKNMAEESSRLKTAFIQNISHELRTPLNGIIGFSNLIVDPETDYSDKFEFATYLQESADRLMKTITDYLDISFIVTDTIPISLNEATVYHAIMEVLPNYIKLAKQKNITIHNHSSDEIKNLRIETDCDLLKKIYLQLIDNAVKFTNQGEINLELKVENNYLIFTIQDTGVGISLEKFDVIFDSFGQEETTSTRNFEGSGLGLAIAKGFAEKLEGTIKIESKKNIGTTAVCSIPLFINNLNY